MADTSLITIKDESSLAFNELFERLGTLNLTPMLIYLIDNVEASALPHLAEQFHILGNEGWLFAVSDEEKRALIKNAVQIHKYKGTKYALEKVLEVLNLNGKIFEWFDYGGNPYHFRVILDFFNRGFDETTEKQLLDLIEETKNVRSVMETLEINLATQAQQKLIALCLTGEDITIYPKVN
ncbi:MAG: hypothetical protein UR30_C0005G0099 [Candidatus Peregrinibacteria bacterium GW2011_GWC2_33_13]|nr:MAG: hypothetical protein UR30_C0005G0099 [Candidatus Peregrinibacteria bacterium GW2011_GWC2_33_13]